MTKPTVFIFHGTGGSPEDNWFPWLKQSLELQGYRVIIPQFPAPEHQSLPSWLQLMQSYTSEIKPDAIFVGHSVGATFALHLLERYSIKATFLVAGFIDLLDNPKFDPLIKTFVEHKFDWSMIQSHCQHFEIFHADNDPYVPLPLAERLANQLQTQLTLLPQAGHINTDAGYTTFPLLLERIKSLTVSKK